MSPNQNEVSGSTYTPDRFFDFTYRLFWVTRKAHGASFQMVS